VRWLIATLERRLNKHGDPVCGQFHYNILADDWHLYADASGVATGGVLNVGGILVEDICKMVKVRKLPKSAAATSALSLDFPAYNIDVNETIAAERSLRLVERYRQAEAEYRDRHNLGPL